MNRILGIVALAIVCTLTVVQAQNGQTAGAPMKTTFVRLTGNANALLQEPVTVDPVRSRIVVLVAHPEGANEFNNNFIVREVTQRGYRALMVNYYGPETVYEEFLAPLGAAIKHLRTVPGVQKVVLAGHSTGGPELSFYQDVAENGLKACQGPERVYKCAKLPPDLPKADGVMLLDANNGASERTIAMDPAVDSRRPRERNPELDMFDPRNGYKPETKSATYSAEFTRKFFAAQGARNNKVIDEALARFAKIEKGEGDYKDDEPFVVPGLAQATNGAQLRLADVRLTSKTKAAHKHLKADGTAPVEIVPSVIQPQASTEDLNTLVDTTQNFTVRHYLSFLALRTTPEYGMTDNDITGVVWRSTPNSVPGNLEGVTVPTLVMVGTCAGHVVLDEIGFHHSAAKDKEFVGVEGGDHSFRPCKPQYGDSVKRAFDYVDSWLSKAGRF